MNHCIFCQIINQAVPAHVLYENDFVIAFLSLENHPMIVPKKHIRDIFELDDLYAAEIMKATVKVAKATRAALGCEGVNLIQSNGKAAGQEVFHFHLHIKPRWRGDDVSLAWGINPAGESLKEKLCADIRRSLGRPNTLGSFD